MKILGPFHIVLHPAPLGFQAGSGDAAGCEIDMGRVDLTRTFELSFEQFATALSEFERLFIEPDGSFVWVAHDGKWQIDGLLSDRNNFLCHVELKGTCFRRQFEQILDCICGEATSLVVQDVRLGLYFAYSGFIRRLESESCQ